MAGKIFVYIDHFKGKPLPASWEVVSAARKIATEMSATVSALVLGQGVESIAQPAFHQPGEIGIRNPPNAIFLQNIQVRPSYHVGDVGRIRP